MSSDKNYGYFDSAGLELDNPFATRGDSTHIYYVHSVKDTFTVRVGMRKNTSKYSNRYGSIFGAPVELATASVTDVTYLSTDFTF